MGKDIKVKVIQADACKKSGALWHLKLECGHTRFYRRKGNYRHIWPESCVCYVCNPEGAAWETL